MKAVSKSDQTSPSAIAPEAPVGPAKRKRNPAARVRFASVEAEDKVAEPAPKRTRTHKLKAAPAAPASALRAPAAASLGKRKQVQPAALPEKVTVADIMGSFREFTSYARAGYRDLSDVERDRDLTNDINTHLQKRLNDTEGKLRDFTTKFEDVTTKYEDVTKKYEDAQKEIAALREANNATISQLTQTIAPAQTQIASPLLADPVFYNTDDFDFNAWLKD